MTTDDPDGPWAFTDPWTITHPRHAVADDTSAAVLDEAAVELTLLRSPMQLGDCLADLHAMVSLLAQIHAWLPVVVAGARDQGHSWSDIAEQLGVTPASARRRYSPYITMDRKAR
jgi:hypothetical protein